MSKSETAPQKIPVVPDDTDKIQAKPLADQGEAKQDRWKRVSSRLDHMLAHKRPYELAMKRCFLLNEGISRIDPDEAPAIKYADVVQPFAATFVETKTAEEFTATTDFEYLPIDDENDAWRVELNMDCVEHSRQKTFAQAKKLDGLRIKNIAGVSIKRKGYKLIMRSLKIPKTEDEYGRMLTWEEKEVPWYDDLFEELVDPFDFVVDPAATNMNDAVDCGQFHRMNFEDAFEAFGKDSRFNFDGIKPGLDNMVEFFEYFNAPRDEWIMYAWPSTGARYSSDYSRRPAVCQEVYFGPLPDNHKMLPFTSQHCAPSYLVGFWNQEGITRSPESGEAAGTEGNIIGHRTFWTPGVPVLIADLIDLRTSYGRQALEALKVAGTNIIATEGSYRFNNKKKWKNGEQAIGMKGKFEIQGSAQAHVGDFSFHFEDLYAQMVQRIGVDPRNITDSKQKTATEDIAQRESSAKRLNAEIEYNEIIEGVRDGMITYGLIQQHYTRMEMVRLSGNETEDELKRYDETKGEHPLTGGKLIGKRYRRIFSKKPLSEFKSGNKNMLRSESQGKYSFLARPEHIQTSEVRVIIVPKRRAGQVQALLRQQAMDEMELWLKFFPLTVANPQTGAEPSVSKDDLPNFRRMVINYLESTGRNPSKDLGQDKEDPQDKKLDEAKDTLVKGHTPFTQIPTATTPMSPAGSVSPPAQPSPAPVATPQ